MKKASPCSTPHGRKLTPKQRVLKRWPDAYAHSGSLTGNWYIYHSVKGPSKIIGTSHETAAKAWADAARSL